MPASASPSCTLATTAFTFSSCDTTLASTRRVVLRREARRGAQLLERFAAVLARRHRLGREDDLGATAREVGQAADARRVGPRHDRHQAVPGEDGALTFDESLLPGVAHPALVGGGEHVGGRALLDLQGQLLRACEVELHSQAGMLRLESMAQLPEGVGERGGGVDGERRRARAARVGFRTAAARGGRVRTA